MFGKQVNCGMGKLSVFHFTRKSSLLYSLIGFTECSSLNPLVGWRWPKGQSISTESQAFAQPLTVCSLQKLINKQWKESHVHLYVYLSSKGDLLGTADRVQRVHNLLADDPLSTLLFPMDPGDLASFCTPPTWETNWFQAFLFPTSFNSEGFLSL